MHQRATKFAELLTSSFAALFSILIIVGVSSLTFNLFQFLQLITLTKNTGQASIVAVLILLHFNYMFVANYGGQELLNHGLKLFKATWYNGLWYAAPLRTQKLLLFIMQKGTINVGFTCGGIFVVSLEGFATNQAAIAIVLDVWMYTDFVISTYTTLLAILIVVGVSSLSINLFQFIQLVRFTNNIRAISISIVILIHHLSYMFVLNYGGQELINHGLQFFKSSYNGLWYAAPLHTQKLLLFIMKRGTINTVFVCGKIYIASLEGFASLTSTAISYFTVIYSTR
ncbi:PREDICTED: uncharacterized protein LOC105459993 [Wasmannia auropunctata]|uniref:uncharacterized protein LOC105459993 n=1 Tax=Wasmannia auropunctata TaxID=64793 RepID=UPI0005EE6743|nr:PREDICTED: uncharacterized protein LOC105459993 [Wasmannia auropunctata]